MPRRISAGAHLEHEARHVAVTLDVARVEHLAHDELAVGLRRGGVGGGVGGGVITWWTDADWGGPLQVTWPWTPVPAYRSTFAVGACVWKASSHSGPAMETSNRAMPASSVTSAAWGFQPTENRGSIVRRPPMSRVGQPFCSAACQRAASSAVSREPLTIATAPTERLASMPISESCTTGTNPTGLPVESVARTSSGYDPAAVGAAPSGRAPRHLECDATDGVLAFGDRHHALGHRVPVAQRCELAAGSVDDRRVTGELATGGHTARADVLEEHLHAEVDRDLTPPGVLATAEQ